MVYVLGIMWGILAGYVSGWFMYNGCTGAKIDRLCTAIAWGVGIGIISFLASIGG